MLRLRNTSSGSKPFRSTKLCRQSVPRHRARIAVFLFKISGKGFVSVRFSDVAMSVPTDQILVIVNCWHGSINRQARHPRLLGSGSSDQQTHQTGRHGKHLAISAKAWQQGLLERRSPRLLRQLRHLAVAGARLGYLRCWPIVPTAGLANRDVRAV